MFVRRLGGTFVLRIEDTDAVRNRPEWVDGIVSAMRWLGLDWDEGPIFQSTLAPRHLEAAQKLFADDRAYYCQCSREVVDLRTKGNAVPGYDGLCRDLGLGPAEDRALRFRTPDTGSTTVVDLIRGQPSFEHSTIEDFVLLRSGGKPMFILANAVDDIEMRITHVVRGEEHLPNTPKALLLWEALGAGAPPVWAHLPLLVNEKRQKLSKRRDKVALESYREDGYLAEAMRNYLALLGWSPTGDREIVTTEEMIAEFRLADVNNSPAYFDLQKLSHINADYIRALPEATFVQRSLQWLEDEDAPWPPEAFDLERFNRVAGLVQTRVQTLGEVPALVDFLFLDEAVIDEASWQKATGKGPAGEILAAVGEEYGSCPWTAVDLHRVTREVGERFGLSLAKAQAPVRVAVTGRTVGLPLFESLEVLGRPRVLERIGRASARLG